MKRKSSRKRLNRGLMVIGEWCKRNRDAPLGYQWRELSLKLRGHYNYYGVRGNILSLSAFWRQVQRAWLKALKARSQKVRKVRLYCLIDHEFALPRPPRHTS